MSLLQGRAIEEHFASQNGSGAHSLPTMAAGQLCRGSSDMKIRELRHGSANSVYRDRNIDDRAPTQLRGCLRCGKAECQNRPMTAPRVRA